MRKAIFTIVKDEKYFLPVWMKYYSKFFDSSDIYILDNDTTDGSTDNLKCQVIKKTSSPYSFNLPWLLKTVQDFQRKLLTEYKLVIFAEADEIIVPEYPGEFEKHIDPNIKTVRCTGYEVFQLEKGELPIDWNKPLLRQRTSWFKYSQFHKPLLSTVPLTWEPGFHRCQEASSHDKNLTLIHLRRIDYNSCKQRLLERRKWVRPPGQNENWAHQWKNSEEQFNKWFYETPKKFGAKNIPEQYKNAV